MLLLPSGLQDTLPPHAARDRLITNALLERFALFGYAQVSPPLLEFETTLFAGKGVAHRENTFRVMDPLSQSMMGMRADITPQIERIAEAMLAAGDASPIRLSYAGQVLRVSASGLSPARQFRQAGLEMIGQREDVSPLEVMTALIEALQGVGLKRLVFSLCSAGLLDVLYPPDGSDIRTATVKALTHKDAGSLPAMIPSREVMLALIEVPSAHVLQAVTGMQACPAPARLMLEELLELYQAVQECFGETVTFHLDPLDTEGFGYHHGVCFTVMEATSRLELGRGGCYTLDTRYHGCGASLYLDALTHSPITPPPQPRIEIVSRETIYAEARALRDQGIMTLQKKRPS